MVDVNCTMINGTPYEDENFYPHKIYKIVREVVDKRLHIDQGADQIKDILKSSSTALSYIVDVFTAIDEEIKAENEIPDKVTDKSKIVKETNDPFKEFRELAHRLIDKNLVASELFKISVPSIINDPKEAETQNRKKLQIKTRIYYKQEKYNLMREENEGYSKLIVDLCEHCDNNLEVGKALQSIRCLIGQFKLDPNRVLDLVLEVFESRLDDSQFFAYIIKALGPSGEDICHLLGFKFSIYQERTNEIVPNSLYNLSAELIKLGLINLEQLAPHLTPTLVQMIEEQKKRDSGSNAKINKPVKPVESLEKFNAESKHARVQINENDHTLSQNQRLGIMCALIQRDHWPNVNALIQRIPEYYAFATSPHVIDVTTKLIDRKLDSYYQKLCPQFLLSVDVPSGSGEETISKKEARSLLCEFLYKIVQPCFAMGPYLGRSTRVHQRIVRCLVELCEKSGLINYHEQLTVAMTRGQTYTDETISDKEIQAFNWCVDLIDECLLPALSVMEGNAPAMEDIWRLIGKLPYPTRYRLYSKWQKTHLYRHSVLADARQKVRAVTSYHLKRLAKETIKATGRQLCKVIHVFPSVVFDAILSQIQAFDNFIAPTVDSIKNLTPLEYDILSYCLINHLCSPDKQKLKASDAALSPWLTSLSTFVAHCFRRYDMELSGVLQYIANELKDGNSFDLLILKDIILMMSGVETSTGMSADLIQAACGGPKLMLEGGRYGEAKNVRRATERLRLALMDENLAVSLCILIAQQRLCLTFDMSSRNVHLKLLGQLIDQCQETFDQFGSFLRSNIPIDMLNQAMPSVYELITKYNLRLESAMFLSRGRYMQMLEAEMNLMLKETPFDVENTDKEGKVTKSHSEKVSQHCYDKALETIIISLGDEIKRALTERDQQPSTNVRAEKSKSIQTVELSSTILAIFWLHTSYNVYLPHSAYKKAIEKIMNQGLEIKTTAKNEGKYDKIKKREVAKYDAAAKELAKERQEQHGWVSRFESRLANADFKLHQQPGLSSVHSADLILRFCLIPRAMMNELDAHYCSQYIKLMHKTNTGSFPTLLIIGSFFGNIATMLSAMTESETNSVGTLACDMLELINHWHSKKEVLQTMIDTKHESLKGFVGPSITTSIEAIINVLFTIHYNISRVMIFKLLHGNYVVCRNSLLFARKILPQYPIIDKHQTAILSKVEFVINREKDDGGRADISLLAKSYSAHLQKRTTPALIEVDKYGHTEGNAMQAKKRQHALAERKAAAMEARKLATLAAAEKTSTPNNDAHIEDGEIRQSQHAKIKAPGDESYKEKINTSSSRHASVPKMPTLSKDEREREKERPSVRTTSSDRRKEDANSIARAALADVGATVRRRIEMDSSNTEKMSANGHDMTIEKPEITNRISLKRVIKEPLDESEVKKSRASSRDVKEDRGKTSRSSSNKKDRKDDRKDRIDDDRKSTHKSSSRSRSRDHHK